MADPLPEVSAALADRYRFERELGRGGMAAVYLFHDLRHDRPVALKGLHPELAATVGPERFRREILTAARLHHPRILTVLDSGTAGRRDGGSELLWFAMPFVDGETLRERLARERQLPVEDAVQIAREAADALEYAHGQGVIHRDVKPAYMSPEQAAGDRAIDPRTDQYTPPRSLRSRRTDSSALTSRWCSPGCT
jgi:eukaryotic-like serine/threonine-protein kinase